MADFYTQMLEAASKIAKETSRNTMSDLCVGTIVSCAADGSGASVELDKGYTVSGELVLQTPFTIENVINIPTQEKPEHLHTLSEELTDKKAVTVDGTPVVFVPTDVPTDDPESIIEYITENADLQTLALRHKHECSRELPNIRLWRGVQKGDKVLVLKVNTRCFVILCRVGDMTNDGDNVEGKDVTTY